MNLDKKKSGLKSLRFIISIVIVGLFIWFLVVSPMIKFHDNENKIKSAALRYFEINKNELPTGERVKTLSLSTLYSKAYMKDDLYIPYSNKVCNQTNSWVKVKKNAAGEYDYLVYLDCGILQSSVDHVGPEIKLKGSKTITLGVGDKYKEPGVSSVVDNNDGKLNVEDVTIKGKVDTSKIGTYEVQYIAFDSLKNKTIVTREVKVIKQISSVVKSDLKNNKNYVGSPTNNYVRLSNMMFRMYGINSDNNIILVAAEDVSNVNFTKISDWLDNYYYKHLTDNAKKLIVKSKYCNMSITDSTTDTTECNSYTKDRYVYIPSVVEVNKAQADSNFMKTYTMSWVANAGENKNAYVTRNVFYDEEAGKSFITVPSTDNYGVRPMLTIKGSTEIVNGDGSLENPYTFGEDEKIVGGEYLNTASTGEYVELDNRLYRVIDAEDGYTKVISDTTINTDSGSLTTSPDGLADKISYNPTDKYSVAYFINNRVSEYVNTSYFASRKINVPIYKNKIIYGEEIKTKSYKVKVFAPDMYEMFSAQTNLYGHTSHSYWYINSSNGKRIAGAITDIGVPLNEEISRYFALGVRPCAYVKQNVVVTSGSGTHEDPYLVR